MSKDIIWYQNALLAITSPATGGLVHRADRSAPSFGDEQRPDARRARDSSNPNYAQYGYSDAAPRYPDGSHQYNAAPHHPVGSNPYPGGQQPYHGGSNGPVIPQGYPSGGYYPPPTSSHSSASGPLISHWRSFLTNQRVQVNIEGYGWLVGTVVAMLGAVQAVTGAFVRVRYICSGRGREDNFPSNLDHVRPY